MFRAAPAESGILAANTPHPAITMRHIVREQRGRSWLQTWPTNPSSPLRRLRYQVTSAVQTGRPIWRWFFPIPRPELPTVRYLLTRMVPHRLPHPILSSLSSLPILPQMGRLLPMRACRKLPEVSSNSLYQGQDQPRKTGPSRFYRLSLD
jgi:hypothetical protein